MYKRLNKNDKETIIANSNGVRYVLNTYTYAALSVDPQDPLFCVSVSNNSFSIDLWTGCLLNCAYCHVQGCYYDLCSGGKTFSMCHKPVRRNSASVKEVVEALVKFCGFIPHYSPISICTSSTEPFLNDEVTESTLEIMECFAELGYKNPFWIVTKIGGIDCKWRERMQNILAHGNKLLLSVCWTNNDPRIEPHTADRFRNLQWMADEGVILNWYMRPLVDDWNASDENLRYIMEYVRSTGLPFTSIAAGGLRWTEGIEFGMKELHHLPMPELLKKDNKKTLHSSTIESIKRLHAEILPEIPLFFKSSCCLSHALGIPNLNALYLTDGEDHCRNCPEQQARLCRRARDSFDRERAEEYLRQKGLNVCVEQDPEEPVLRITGRSYEDTYIGLKYLTRYITV